MPSTLRATFIGFTATMMWATLPVVALVTSGIPAYQVTAGGFLVAFTISAIKWRMEGRSIIDCLKLPLKLYALGIFGLFGFHFFYFTAIRSAAPVEALLIINLWPLLMVLFTVILEKARMRWWHIAGLIGGFSGILVIALHNGVDMLGAHWSSYAAALTCAVIWCIYSIASRRMADEIPPHAIGVYCLASAILLWMLHLAVEETVTLSLTQAATIVYIGLAPMGLAFYTWDYGVRNGDMRVLGSLSYLAPIMAAFTMAGLGYAKLAPHLFLAGALILGGAFISTAGTFFRR